MIEDDKLRDVATAVVEKAFGLTLDAATRNEFVNSVARQWKKFEGNAGLVTMRQVFWLKVREEPDGKIVYGINGPYNQNVLAPYVRDWNIDPAQVPDILHQLNINQYALILTRDGEKRRFAMQPLKRSIGIDEPK